MVAGRAAFQTSSDVNTIVGGVCNEVESLMHRIQNIQAFMAATDLTAAPYSMSSADSGIVKGAMTVLDAVRIQYNAQGNITFVKQCVGIPNG